MSIPRTVAEVIREHVCLEVEGIDRMYLNVYVPTLQREGGVASFFRFHRGYQFASSALMDPISKAFVAEMEQFAKQGNIPVVRDRKASCSSARPRRRHRCSARSGGVMKKRGPRIPGWCDPPRWSITSTCTAWIGTSVHSSSNSAHTFPTQPSFA